MIISLSLGCLGQTRILTSFRLNSSSEAIQFESSSCKALMHLLCCRKKNAVAEVMNFVLRILIIEVLYTFYGKEPYVSVMNAKQTNPIVVEKKRTHDE